MGVMVMKIFSLCGCSRPCERIGNTNNIGFRKDLCCNCFLAEYRPNDYRIFKITDWYFVRCETCFETIKTRIIERLCDDED